MLIRDVKLNIIANVLAHLSEYCISALCGAFFCCRNLVTIAKSDYSFFYILNYILYKKNVV